MIADLPSQDSNAKEVLDAIQKLGNGTKASFVELDAASEESWIAAMEKIESTMGPISVLVNGAGIAGVRSVNLEDLELSAFRQTMAVNLDGVFLGAKHGAKSMMKLPADWDKSQIQVRTPAESLC